MAALFLFAGGALVVAGSLLPWVTVDLLAFGVAASGELDKGGWGTAALLLGVATLALAPAFALRPERERLVLRAACWTSGLATGVALLHVWRLWSQAGPVAPDTVNASVGSGVWALAGGAVVAQLARLVR